MYTLYMHYTYIICYNKSRTNSHSIEAEKNNIYYIYKSKLIIWDYILLSFFLALSSYFHSNIFFCSPWALLSRSNGSILSSFNQNYSLSVQPSILSSRDYIHRANWHFFPCMFFFHLFICIVHLLALLPFYLPIPDLIRDNIIAVGCWDSSIFIIFFHQKHFSEVKHLPKPNNKKASKDSYGLIHSVVYSVINIKLALSILPPLILCWIHFDHSFKKK